MQAGEMQYLMNSTLLVVLRSSAPALGIAAGVGLTVGLLQAVTQVQDQSLPQTLKLVAVLVAVAVLGPLLGGGVVGYTGLLFDRIAEFAR